MANNPEEGHAGDDFLEQILSMATYAGLAALDDVNSSTKALVPQLGLHHHPSSIFPLGLSLDNGCDEARAFACKPEREGVDNNKNHLQGNSYPAFDDLQPHPPVPPQIQQQGFQGQPTPSTTVSVVHPPAIRPRVRARRGQATDPHSIAERLRRERISESIKALQELVSSCNKSDRDVMLDEILDYVKFLRLQVKVLSMSRLGGAVVVAQLVAVVPQSIEVYTSINEHV